MKGATPWAAWMTFAFGGLRLSPHAFWRLSLTEWAVILRAHGLDGGDILTKAALDRLIEAYPDKKGD